MEVMLQTVPEVLTPDQKKIADLVERMVECQPWITRMHEELVAAEESLFSAGSRHGC